MAVPPQKNPERYRAPSFGSFRAEARYTYLGRSSLVLLPFYGRKRNFENFVASFVLFALFFPLVALASQKTAHGTPDHPCARASRPGRLPPRNMGHRRYALGARRGVAADAGVQRGETGGEILSEFPARTGGVWGICE